jgi:hypothetical protein
MVHAVLKAVDTSQPCADFSGFGGSQIFSGFSGSNRAVILHISLNETLGYYGHTTRASCPVAYLEMAIISSSCYSGLQTHGGPSPSAPCICALKEP